MFFLLLLVLKQSRAGGKNGGESQEQAADRRSVFLRNNAREDADDSSEYKPENELVPFRPAKCRQIDGDVQSHLPQQKVPKAKGNSQPQRDQTHRNRKAGQMALHHQPRGTRRVNKKRRGTGNHRASFNRGVDFSLRRNRQAQRRQRDRRRSAKKSRETFGFKDIADRREDTNNKPADQEAKKELCEQ